MIFYYSGCGNSRWVAENLSAALDDSMYFIPDYQAGMLSGEFPSDVDVEGKVLGFVFPVYAWAAPRLVEDFVGSVKWTGKPSYVWFACTCGDEMGLTHRLFEATLRNAGLPLDAAFCFQMPETYLCLPGFHLDSEAGARRKIAAALGKMPEVADSIRKGERRMDLLVGTMPRLKSYVIRPGFVKNVSDRGYHVLESCIGCGKCVSVCPLHNISLADGRPLWHGGCTQCMACYHYCPVNAIQYSSYTKGKGQYRFADCR